MPEQRERVNERMSERVMRIDRQGRHGIRQGDTIRHKQTGELQKVVAYNPTCGNVYIGGRGGRYEVNPRNWEKVVNEPPKPKRTPRKPAKTKEPAPVVVASNGNGNGAHANGSSNGHVKIPVTVGRWQRIIQKAKKEKEKVGV